MSQAKKNIKIKYIIEYYHFTIVSVNFYLKIFLAYDILKALLKVEEGET